MLIITLPFVNVFDVISVLRNSERKVCVLKCFPGDSEAALAR